MKLLNLIIALGLCGFAILGFFAAKSDPVFGSIVFDTLSIVLFVGLILLYLKRVKIEVTYIIFSILITLMSIYLHVSFKVNPFEFKYAKNVILFLALVFFLGGLRILTSPRKRR